mmetsp:Transcript_14183/g.35878  ORF Transcript_14183/g.35878 Transcript_14183/m.35878 type:complete len:347 (-) Transcript_14183:81-1121(-)
MRCSNSVLLGLLAAFLLPLVALGQRDCSQDLDVLRGGLVAATPDGTVLDLTCNMTYNPCEPGAEFRFRDPVERIANFGPVEITCGSRQILGCDQNGCLTEVTMADLGLQVNGTMDLLTPLPSLEVFDIDGYCELGASVGGECLSEFNGTIGPFIDGVGDGLNYLSVRGTYLEGDMTSVGQLKNLEHLDLYGNMELKGDMNGPLSGLPNLEYLNLMSTCVNIDTSTLGGLVELVFLNLHAWGRTPPREGCPLVTGPFDPISKLTKLQYLDATNWQSEGNLDMLDPLTELETLYLGNFDGTMDIGGNTGSLENLKNLTTLQLNGLSNADNMGSCADLPWVDKCTFFLK